MHVQCLIYALYMSMYFALAIMEEVVCHGGTFFVKE